MTEKGYVGKFYNENRDENGLQLKSKRQASKFINRFGSHYKISKGIPMEYSKRTMKEVPQTMKSDKNIKRGKK